MQSSLSSSEMAARLLSYERSTETDVILVLPGGKANRDFVRMVVEENQAGRPFRLDDLLLLSQLWLERNLTVSRLLLRAKSAQRPGGKRIHNL
jgi:ATP-dependent DNA helicase RecG